MPSQCSWCRSEIEPGTVHTPTSLNEPCTVTRTGKPAAPPSAHEITASLLIQIPERWPALVRVWRANVVAGKIDNRFIRAGVPGQADISGIGPRGVRIEIEVKAGSDRLSEKQRAFRDMILRLGGIWVEARSVDQALRDLEYQINRRRG